MSLSHYIAQYNKYSSMTYLKNRGTFRATDSLKILYYIVYVSNKDPYTNY